MNLINIENLTKVYTERKLFDGASFSLQDGEKVGIIGINGTGKTTLLRMIMGEEETDEGTVTTANHVVIRYLPQHPEFEPEKSSLECVLEGNVTDENRWSVESDAKAMMTRLGIKDFMQPAGQLSGGQRKRLALISVLLSPADILLLDEPTNHLDNDMADWLEDYLKKWRGALIMVTHDRYFLDSVCNRIVEIDKGKIYSYQANYSGYLEHYRHDPDEIHVFRPTSGSAAQRYAKGNPGNGPRRYTAARNHSPGKSSHRKTTKNDPRRTGGRSLFCRDFYPEQTSFQPTKHSGKFRGQLQKDFRLYGIG